MITARGGGGNGRAALRSRTMCSLRTVIAQAAVMGNIYRLADYPVILMPGGAADAAVPHGRLGTEPRRNRQSTCPDRNPIRQVTCGSYGHQAACAHPLIRPLSTGFRRITAVPRLAMRAAGRRIWHRARAERCSGAAARSCSGVPDPQAL
jgi:hypothetical protein